MQKSKKIFSALLAIVMLVSVFTFTTNAGAPAPSGDAKVSVAFEVVNASGEVVTAVNPGETVTVNVYSNAASATDTLTEFKISVFYDGAVFSYVADSLKWVGLADWVSTAGSTFDVYTAGNTYFDAIVAKATDEELTMGWNTMAYCVGVASGDADYLVQENANNVMYSFDLKVSDTAAAGTAANVGCYEAASYISRTKSYCYIKTPSTGSRIASGAVSMPATQALTVQSAEAPSIVLANKDQIRFQRNADGTYAKKFDVRTLAKFSVEDFKTLSGGKTPEQAITGAGFIYARNKTVAETDMAAIKAYFADGSALPTGYVDKSVDYITTKAALVGEGNYGFSCIITDIADPTYVNDKVAVVGYIAYTDADGKTAYNFYEAVNETSFNGLYTTYYPQAAAKYGW